VHPRAGDVGNLHPQPVRGLARADGGREARLMGAPADPVALVHHEARLIDRQDWAGWLALYTHDAHYWVPVSRAMASAFDGPSHFNDDRQLMEARVHRLANPRAFGAEPAPRTAHLLSGVGLEQAGEATAVVTSTQLILEWRARGRFEADQRLFGGEVTHRLRHEHGQWRIAAKRIDLVNAEASMNALLAPF
jgi:3-phenylpropionate/cinnamic acid dioxygenase small subunit